MAVLIKRSATTRKVGTALPLVREIYAVSRASKEAKMKEVIALRLHAKELLSSNRLLKKEVLHREKVELALKKSELHLKESLLQSRRMQEQLRYLSHQLIAEQEEQRKKISRELHDEISQILAGINVYLAELKIEASDNTKGLSKKISRAQRLVQKSVKIIHRFASNLRPAVLDDLGIIPALNTYLKSFTKRTGIKIHLKAFAEIEQLNSVKRTVLYRVAQAALANVAQHSNATLVNVTIRKLTKFICMEIHDNGKSFDVEGVLSAKMNEHLGLIGMRERVEMLGGRYGIRSSPGHGTTISVEIPTPLLKSMLSSVKKRPSILI